MSNSTEVIGELLLEKLSLPITYFKDSFQIKDNYTNSLICCPAGSDITQNTSALASLS